MGKWVNEWMSERIIERSHACMNGWMNACMNARMNAWMHAWMHGWMDAWMDETSIQTSKLNKGVNIWIYCFVQLGTVRGNPKQISILTSILLLSSSRFFQEPQSAKPLNDQRVQTSEAIVYHSSNWQVSICKFYPKFGHGTSYQSSRMTIT